MVLAIHFATMMLQKRKRRPSVIKLTLTLTLQRRHALCRVLPLQ
jgi:hypothetical protein